MLTRRYSVLDMLMFIEEINRNGCERLYKDHKQRFIEAQGSTNNHQAWPGGYFDHISEIMNIGIALFDLTKSIGRPVPFTLSDVLLVTYLHDIEKTVEI